jgi:hypothetical protein
MFHPDQMLQSFSWFYKRRIGRISGCLHKSKDSLFCIPIIPGGRGSVTAAVVCAEESVAVVLDSDALFPQAEKIMAKRKQGTDFLKIPATDKNNLFI